MLTPRVRVTSPLVAISTLIASTVIAALPTGSATAAVTDPVVTQTDLEGPAGSEAFGVEVTVLANGNFVVTDPLWDDGATADVLSLIHI